MKPVIITSLTLIALFLISVSVGCVEQNEAKIQNTTVVTPIPTPPPNLTDEQKLEKMFVDRFNQNIGWNPDSNVVLVEDKNISEYCMRNAINGTHCFKMLAKIPDEAFLIYLSRPGAGYLHEEWATHYFTSQGFKYGIAVYKTTNGYNVSMAFGMPQTTTYSTKQNPDGSFSLAIIKPYTSYYHVWWDSYPPNQVPQGDN